LSRPTNIFSAPDIVAPAPEELVPPAPAEPDVPEDDPEPDALGAAVEPLLELPLADVPPELAAGAAVEPLELPLAALSVVWARTGKLNAAATATAMRVFMVFIVCPLHGLKNSLVPARFTTLRART
jgi:hypothetical protein